MRGERCARLHQHRHLVSHRLMLSICLTLEVLLDAVMPLLLYIYLQMDPCALAWELLLD